MTERVFSVEGMSCDHCVHAITAEVSKVPGVTGVMVDLATRTVTVSGQPLDDAAIGAAVDEAGYTVLR
jgi:copper chaperone CopZ